MFEKRHMFDVQNVARKKKREIFTAFLLKLFIELQPPSSMDINNSINYSIQRPPTGFLDILFLDNTMRITKGNKNSIVVVERV